VRTLIVAANKMDRVNWSAPAYRAAVDQVETLAAELGFSDVTVIPVSALLGDNVVERSTNIPWYDGPTVLEALESSKAGTWTATGHGARLPIQWVLRQPGGGRTYAGMVSAHALHVGDAVTLLPAGVPTTVTEIHTGRGRAEEAEVGLSVSVSLADETDAGRGDLLAVAPLPRVTREVAATICWFGEHELVPGRRLRLKHTTRVTPARVATLDGVVDVATLEVVAADELTTNQIGLATIHTADPVVVDDYRDNRVTGSFVLIDDVTNATVAAGMVGRASFL
jgi:sulfate adenylyltransferase subunit 1 (EFTu-like GTPase family)